MKRSRQHLALLLVLALLHATTTVRAQSDALTLPLAVEIALKTNPLVKATATGRDIADARLLEARASRWPVVQVSQNVTNGNNPVYVFGSLLEQANFKASNFDLNALNNPSPLTNFRTSLNVRTPLFDQRQSRTRISQAELQQQQVDTNSSQMQQQIRFEVLRSYYAVLLAQAKKEVALEAIKMAEADVKRSRDRVEAGVAVTSDLLSAEVQLAEFRQQQIQAEGEIITATAALNTALGLPINTPQQISGALLEKQFDLAEQEALIRTALQSRPEYARAGLTLREREQQTFGARGEMLPRVEAFTSVGVSARSFLTGSTDYVVGASVSFNLFDAGRKARISQAQAAETIATLEQQHLANQIRLEVVRARQQFITARERLAVMQRVISQATEALRIVQDRYHEGLTTITEVLRAETALTQARTNVLAARYDHYIGYATVLLATGQLTDVQPFVS
ncbi:MAG TPA: TolC family protein [Blastocatellia bacterium]|nr:TolC family protein [Blastocatellia bacterium]